MIGNKCYELRSTGTDKEWIEKLTTTYYVIPVIVKRQQKQHDYYLLRSTSISKETTEVTLLVWRLKEIIVILSLSSHNRKQKLGVSKSSLSSHYRCSSALPQTKFPSFFSTSLFPSSTLPHISSSQFPTDYQNLHRRLRAFCDLLPSANFALSPSQFSMSILRFHNGLSK